MTGLIIHGCAHGGLDIEESGDPPPALTQSCDLLVRARVGWERFIDSFEEPSDG
ncbi:hypothetical protein [Streptomyces vinaceus]|uniref:hypothetical protein n=1 Tax=Streptomyces vinaceus TaxID=1960 RepID=UPI0010D12AAE|nr:hypothetical protein [Streptomyces vinaceus]GHE48401.1 hypothetical protein GCM10017778_35410 [Streptomyces vinaceus]